MSCGTYDPDEAPAAKPDKKTAELLAATDPRKDNKHSILRCETRHGPMAFHIDATDKAIPKVGSDKLCLVCHRQITGRPRTQPQVVLGDHGGTDPASVVTGRTGRGRTKTRSEEPPVETDRRAFLKQSARYVMLTARHRGLGTHPRRSA